MQTITEHRKERIAAEVAARYGVQVMPDAVQIIPQGVSGFPGFVFDGFQLVPVVKQSRGEAMRAIKAANWRNAARQRRLARAASEEKISPAAKSPRVIAAEARLDQVRDMAAKGATVKQIAAYLGILEKSAGKYCRDHGVPVAKVEPKRKEILAAKCAAALAFGQESPRTIKDYAAFLGTNVRSAHAFVTGHDLPWVRVERGATGNSQRDRQIERGKAIRARIEARRVKVARMFSDGLSMRAIARKLGVMDFTIKQDVVALGLDRSTSSAKSRSEAQEDRARRMIEAREAKIRAKKEAAEERRRARNEAEAARKMARAEELARKVSERRAAVKEMRLQGMSIPRIANQLGVARSVVDRDISALGLTTKVHPCGYVGNVALMDQVRDLRAKGLSGLEIARRMGIAKSTLWRMTNAMEAA